ncbi:MAG: hypothetical protein SA339_10835 [Methanomassiliicoccus sp.]|nr:hypothetical protein [Methanomassiliicoccus sp.]
MGRVKVGEHLWVNLSRRSLCDNCSADLCTYHCDDEIVEKCEHFSPILVAFKRCKRCGSVYEVSSNFKALDYELCPQCNAEVLVVSE